MFGFWCKFGGWVGGRARKGSREGLGFVNMVFELLVEFLGMREMRRGV